MDEIVDYLDTASKRFEASLDYRIELMLDLAYLDRAIADTIEEIVLDFAHALEGEQLATVHAFLVDEGVARKEISQCQA